MGQERTKIKALSEELGRPLNVQMAQTRGQRPAAVRHDPQGAGAAEAADQQDGGGGGEGPFDTGEGEAVRRAEEHPGETARARGSRAARGVPAEPEGEAEADEGYELRVRDVQIAAERIQIRDRKAQRTDAGYQRRLVPTNAHRRWHAGRDGNGITLVVCSCRDMR